MQHSINHHAENLRAAFFGDDETGFYSTFGPLDGTAAVGAESVNGRKLLKALGVRIVKGGHERIFVIENNDDLLSVYPYLFRKGDAYWAGYWDGDGVAITGLSGDNTWAMSTDVKCDYYWDEIPNPLKFFNS